MMNAETKEDFYDSYLFFAKDAVGRAKYKADIKNIHRRASLQAEWMEEKILFHKQNTDLASVFHAFEKWRDKLNKYGPCEKVQKRFI